jgi:hypothetical protein
MYGYILSNDKSSACITNYYGPTDIKKLIIPDTIDGYPVISIGGERSIIVESYPFGTFDNQWSLSYIPYALFERCNNLEEIKLPKQLEWIGAGAFSSTKLKKVVLPDTVTYIGAGAFASCWQLEEVTLSKNVEIIEHYAFSGIAYCEALNIPQGWSHMWNDFLNKDITAYWNIAQEDIKSNDLFEYLIIDNKIKITKYIGNENILEIPRYIDGIIVNSIGDFAFFLTSIKNLIINDNIISFGKGSFFHCTLENISIPNTITSFEDSLFEGSAICKIYVPAESLDAYKTAKGLSEYRDIIFPFEDN